MVDLRFDSDDGRQGALSCGAEDEDAIGLVKPVGAEKFARGSTHRCFRTVPQLLEQLGAWESLVG